jgi:hypothetical protein
MKSRKISWGLVVFMAVGSCVWALGGDVQPQPGRSQAYWEKMLKDTSLIRLYRIDEPSGFSFRNEAGQIDATIAFTTCSPYGNSRDARWDHNWYSSFYPNPERIQGRWPEKMAITPGIAFKERNPSRNLTRSGYGGTQDGIFTLSAWIRLREQGTCSLFNIDGSMKIQNRMGKLDFRYGSAHLASDSVLTAELWHHLAVQCDGKTMRIFLDGEEAAHKAFTGPVPKLAKLLDNPYAARVPSSLIGGLNIGGHLPYPKIQPVFFDLDELAIFGRALSSEEVRAAYDAGKPDANPEQQKQAFQILAREKQIQQSIRMEIPKESMGYFQRGQEIPATIEIQPESGLRGEFQAHFLLRNELDEVFAQETRPLTVEPGRKAEATIRLKPQICGVYYLDMWVSDSQGKVMARLPEEYGLGITVELPPIASTPLTSPLGTFVNYEGQFMGIRLHRQILWPARFKDRKNRPYEIDYDAIADRINKTVPDGSDLKLLYTIYVHIWGERVPGKKAQIKDMTRWSNYCRELVRRFKHKVYAWEIGNEPNAGGLTGGFSAEEYVLFLKTAYEAIKAEDPDAIVVGLCGCPGFINWNKRVFEAGGAKYFDVLSVHDYGADPIFQYHEYDRIGQVIEQLKKYRGEVVPIWNSESGWHSIARERNRPLSQEGLALESGGRVHIGKNGEPYFWAFLPTTTESNAAAMQVQSILMNLGAGCAKYIKIHSPSEFSPAYNGSDGQPTLMGVSLAAASKAMMHTKAISFLPMSSKSDAAVVLAQEDGSRSLALFSDDPSTVFFRCSRPGILRGMDMTGNPLVWTVGPEKMLRLQLGSAPIYLFDIPGDFAQLPVASVSRLPETMPKNGVMTGTLTLHNPYNRRLDVLLSSSLPAGSKLDVPKSYTLEAHGSGSVPFALTATALERRKYTFSISVKEGSQLIGKMSHQFDSEGSVHAVPVLKESAALGDQTWWQGIAPTVRNTADRVIQGKPIPGVPWAPQWRGAQDLSFTVRQAWVEGKGLFVRVEATDDTFLPAPADEKHSFRYDCMELFFDGRLLSSNRWDSKLKPEQMVVTPSGNTEASPCRFWFPSKKPTVNAAFIGGRAKTGYWIEGQIAPLPGMEKIHPVNAQYGLEIMMDDADRPDALRKAIQSLHRENPRADWTHWGQYRLTPSGNAKK